MKYMLLIQYGDTPVPPSEEWDRLSQDEQKAAFAGYQAVNETPGVSPGEWLQHPTKATTVRVQEGTTLTTDDPSSPSRKRWAATTSTRPTTSMRRSSLRRRSRAARMGGSVEVRPLKEQ
jgi:hypothetical protein